MAMACHSHFAITLFIIFSLFFFIFTVTINTPPLSPSQRSLLSPPHGHKPCSILQLDGGLLNYFSLHSCTFNSNPFHSLPFLSLFLLLYFYFLILTANTHFTPVVTALSSLLSLNPSMAAVTLLALGNGAPDVFASVAAVSGGNPRTGFGAILSAGTFVSAFVVGVVGINAGPFTVDSTAFVRDVFFYFIAAFIFFYVYLTGELYFWQALGFVAFYLFFVAFVFWMDLGSVGKQVADFEKQHQSGGNILESHSFDSYKSGFITSFNKEARVLQIIFVFSILQFDYLRFWLSLSAGTFVSGFVLGVDGTNASSFSVDSSAFVRDVLFYFMGGLMLFYVYFSRELYFWQAVGFYLFFVGFIFEWILQVNNKLGNFEKQEESDGKILDCEKEDHSVKT